jgi:hypothetical protein
MGLKKTSWSTLALSDFIRVPLPAARTTAVTKGAIIFLKAVFDWLIELFGLDSFI